MNSSTLPRSKTGAAVVSREQLAASKQTQPQRIVAAGFGFPLRHPSFGDARKEDAGNGIEYESSANAWDEADQREAH